MLAASALVLGGALVAPSVANADDPVTSVSGTVTGNGDTANKGEYFVSLEESIDSVWQSATIDVSTADLKGGNNSYSFTGLERGLWYRVVVTSTPGWVPTSAAFVANGSIQQNFTLLQVPTVTVTGHVTNWKEAAGPLVAQGFYSLATDPLNANPGGSTVIPSSTGDFSVRVPKGLPYYIMLTDAGATDSRGLTPSLIPSQPIADTVIPATWLLNTNVGQFYLTRADGNKSTISAGTVSVSGVATVGHALTATSSGWFPTTASLRYKWYRNGAPITGAVWPRYTLTALDVHKKITVAVTASSTGYTSRTVSSASKVPPLAVFSPKPTAAIKGSARVGGILSTTIKHRPTVAHFTYVWYANGKAIKHATHSTFRPTSAQRGAKISVKVTITKTNYVSVKATVSAKSRVAR